MEQLTLTLANRLTYASENFLLHSGVSKLHEDLLSLFLSNPFVTAFVVGAPRSGKTHLSIKILDTLLKKGKFPRIVEGREFASWLQTNLRTHSFTSDEVVIVDDAESYFEQIPPGQSGAFVNLIEGLRVKRAGILMLSGASIESFPCDEHIKSRLTPGMGFSIGAPSEDELSELLQLMARQRGINLSDRKVDFLSRRIGRDIASMEEYLEKVSHLSGILGKSIKFPLLSDAI